MNDDEYTGSADENVKHLLGERVTLAQPLSGFRAAIDSVLLAAAVSVSAGDKVLDAGCGTAAAALCLAAREKDVSVTGMEIQADMARYALRNVKANGVDGRVGVIQGDITSPPLEIQDMLFDHVMANPPYMEMGAGSTPPDPSRAIATVEGEHGIDPWITFPASVLKNKGTLTVIHRAERLPDILSVMSGRFGDIRVFPLWPGPGADKPAKRVIVQARKGSNAPLRLLPGLVLHRKDGSYTRETDAILRDAAPITL